MMLAGANLREHWRSFLATFLAVLVGVGVIATTLIVYDSGRPRPQPRLAGAPVLVVAHQVPDQGGVARGRVSWSESEASALVEKLGAIRDVQAAIIDRSFYAQLFESGAPVPVDPVEAAEEAGHGWSSTRLAPYELTSGRAPQGGTEVVVGDDLDVAAGSSITLGLVDGARTYTVSGVIDGPGLYFTDEEASRRDTGVTTIALLVEPDAAGAIAERADSIVAGGGSALTGTARGVVEADYITHRRFLGAQLISAMAIMALFTTAFVVAATLALATAQRRREIALLRTIGADARQIRRMVLGEAVIIGLTASVVGCVAGVAAAPAVLGILERLDVTAPDSRIVISPWPLLVATLVGTGVAVLGAWAASRSAVRIAPIEALQDAQGEHRPMTRGHWVAGLGALTLGVVLAVVTALGGEEGRVNLAIATSMCLIAAAGLLAPVVIGPVARLVTAPFARRAPGAGAMLVRAELLNSPRRAASAAAPVIVAVGFAVLISGLVTTMALAYPAQTTQRLAGQVLIDPGDAPGLNETVVQDNPVGRAPLPTRLFVARPGGGEAVVDGVGSRDPRWSQPGAAVLDTETAEFLDVGAGATLTVRFADGLSSDLQVAAVLPPDPARGPFVLARDTVRQHDTTAMTDHIFMPADHAPNNLTAGATLQDAEQFALQDYNTDAALTNSLALMLTVLAVGYSGLAVANSMAMAAHGRRSDFTVMKSAGGTRPQLLRFTIAETALLVLIGSALGLLATLPPLAGVASGLSAQTTTSVPLSVNGGVLAAAVLASLAIATAASALVTWNGLRPRTT